MRIASINEFSILTLTKAIIGSMVLATVFFGVVGFASIRFISSTETSWNEYKYSNSPRAKALASVVGTLGYGGMIHQFKNYVIRQDIGRVEKIRQRAAVALFALNRVELFDNSEQTVAAVAQVKSVINAYASNAQTLIDLVEAGKTSKEIDAALSIDDAPAIEGLEILFAQLRNQNPGAPLSKNYYLGQLRRALGFNGMIHQFKNYIIRRDTPRVMKATKAMEAAKSAISSYENLGTTATEQAVIANVSESASRITNDISQISQASQQLANRTETQAQTLGQTSAALNQLTISVNSVAVGAQDANTVVLDAKYYA